MIVYDQFKDWFMVCLDSLVAQTHKDIEIIVSGVRDDPALEWAKVFDGVKVVGNQFPDPKVQINNALKFATGEYIIVVGSDDYYYPNSIEKLVKVAAEKDSVIVYPDLHYADDELNVVFHWKAPKQFDMNKLHQSQIMTDSSLVKKSVLWEFGFFKAEWRKFAMWDMWLRIAEKYPYSIHHSGHVLCKYRRHDNALGIRAFRGDLVGTGEDLRRKFFEVNRIKPAIKTRFVSNWIITDYGNMELTT